ncbi:WD40 repeat domain-containing protein [Terrabacter tumescens]|nr:WD40 repeat domain-containing protein [Terrabacter tumescens]
MSTDAAPAVAPARTNPYVGPQSFRRGDQLYGRDREAADLVDLLVAERIVLLHSPSGAGKTSLIQARLVPMLEEEGFEVLPIVRVNREPADVPGAPAGINRYVLSTLLSLEEGLPAAIQHTVTELAGMTLAQYLAQRPDMDGRPGNEVLVFDQFEEVITADPVDQDAKAAFFTDLSTMLADRKLWALFAAREDFLAEFAPYVRPLPTRLSTRYRLDLLTADQALDAMTLPARAVGVEFDHDAARRLVDDLRKVRVQHAGTVTEEEGPHVEPVQLQVVCRLMWDRLSREARRVEIADVEAVGDVDKALADYYATSVAGVCGDTGLPERSLRDWIETALVTNQGFRAQVMRGPAGPDDVSERVLRTLTDRHLLRAESRRGAVWYELAHDRLVEPIQHDNEHWRRRHLTTLEHRARDWEAQARPDRLLLTGPDLAAAHRWADSGSQPLTEVELALLHASDAAEQQLERLTRANARTRRWLVATVIVCALALVAAGLALRSSTRAREAAQRAAQAGLVGQAMGRLDVDNQLGLLLGERATKMTVPGQDGSSWQTENLLQLALDETPVMRTFRSSHGPAIAVTYSDDGARVGTVASDGTIEVWDAQGGSVVASRPGIGTADALSFSPDGDRIAVGGADGRVAIWTPSKASFVVVVAPATKAGTATHAVSFSPDGSLLACAYDNGTLSVLRSDTGREVQHLVRSGAVRDVGWAGRGSKLVAVDDSGELAAWDTGRTQSSGSWKPVFTSAASQKMPGSAVAVALDVSPDGSLVATGAGSQVVIWDVTGGRKVVVKALRAAALDVSFTSDPRRVLALDAYGNLSMVDTGTGQETGFSFWETGTLPRGIAADPTRTDRAVVQTGTGDAAVWNLPETHSDLVTSLDMTGDGTVVTGAWDGSVRLWSVTGAQVTAVSAASTSASAEGSTHSRLVAPVKGRGVRIVDTAVDPGGRFVVTADTAGAVVVTPLSPDETRPQLDAAATPKEAIGAAAVAVSPDGTLIATGGAQIDHVVRLWDAATGLLLSSMDDHSEAIVGLAFGADGKQLVSISRDGTAILWDIASHHAIRTLNVAENVTGLPAARAARSRSGSSTDPGLQLGDVAWSSGSQGSSRVAVAVGTDVQLWDPGTGQLERTLRGHLQRVASVAFDATGRRLVSASDDNTAVIWDAADGHVVRRITHRGWIAGARFVPGGDRVVLAGRTYLPTVAWLDDDALLKDAEQRTTRRLSTVECDQFQQLAGEDWQCSLPTTPGTPTPGVTQ